MCVCVCVCVCVCGRVGMVGGFGVVKQTPANLHAFPALPSFHGTLSIAAGVS